MSRVILLLTALFLLPWSAQAGTVISDITNRHIAVTSGFTGATTTLFGALPEAGDVIIVVQGPPDAVVVRRKEQMMGLWVNGPSARFADVPGFYWVAASRPLSEIAPPGFLEARRIGIAHQRFTVTAASRLPMVPAFQTALIDLKQRDRTFVTEPLPIVTILEQRLYRADLVLPANAPTGTYQVTTYLLKNGQLIDAQQVPLSLQKEGAMDNLSVIAQTQAPLYALGAIGLALLTGWLSAVLMQRR